MIGFVWFLLTFGPTPAILAGDGAADRPLAVTTDTASYCDELVHEIARESAHPPPGVASLSAEGQFLCAEGHVPAGLKRLRRAILMLQGPQATR